MRVPTSKFQLGDEVDVRIVDSGLPPTFRAQISRVEFSRLGGVEYEAIEEDGQRSDGYTDEWLTAHRDDPFQGHPEIPLDYKTPAIPTPRYVHGVCGNEPCTCPPA